MSKFFFYFMMGVIILATILFIYSAVTTDELKFNHNQESFFCGTKSELNSDTIASHGKQIFNSNCAACHKLHADMSGPSLIKVWNIYKAKNANLEQYLKGKRNKKLFKNFKSIDNVHCAIFPNLTREDIISLEKYFEPIYD